MVKQLELQNGETALIDDEDYEKCRKYTWTVQAHAGKERSNTQRRVFTSELDNGKRKTIKLSTFILGPAAFDGRLLYFKNGNDLDFRKDNLSFAEDQSLKNQRKRGWRGVSSKYKGVSWAKQNNKWCARIGLRGVYKNLGYFDNEDDAAIAYNKAARQFYGEEAFQNEIGMDNSAALAKIERILKPRKPKKFTSSFRGVSLDKSYNPPSYRVRVRNKQVGIFCNEVDAARRYDREALKAFGEKAVLNFPDENRKE